MKHSSSLIASLAFETGKQFKITDNSLKAVEEPLVQKWRKYLQLKATFYLSYVSQPLLTIGIFGRNMCVVCMKSEKRWGIILKKTKPLTFKFQL